MVQQCCECGVPTAGDPLCPRCRLARQDGRRRFLRLAVVCIVILVGLGVCAGSVKPPAVLLLFFGSFVLSFWWFGVLNSLAQAAMALLTRCCLAQASSPASETMVHLNLLRMRLDVTSAGNLSAHTCILPR